jgi:hypothetical protein
MASMSPTVISSTGHLAMSQTLTTAEPRPGALPAFCASPPVTTTIPADSTGKTSPTMVTRSRTGAVFQIGRPSAMPYMALEARVNAPT